MLINNISDEIKINLSILVGQRLNYIARSVLMLNVGFGDDVEYIPLSGANKRLVARFALHIHSSWRIIKDDDIYLSQSAMFTHMNGFRWCEDSDYKNTLFFEISEEINKMLETRTICVQQIEANNLGDLKITMENGFVLEVFADSIGNTESWRFFRMDDDSSHFVVFDEDDK